MRLPIPTKKDYGTLFLLILSIFIVYFCGIQERIHPKEHTINFQQTLQQPDDISCGPTSAAIILNHYNKNTTIDQVKEYTNTVWFSYHEKDIGMTSPDYLVKALNKLGVEANLKYGNLDILKHYIAQNKPCIVLVRSGEKSWHYLVVYGFTENKISVSDPGNNTLYDMTTEQFLGCWSWTQDMHNNLCNNEFVPTLLKTIEIYPYTFILPSNNHE
jgi:ABC-type bacteriocin/lantibiotic exporter with double-glycine peptidase domain